MNSFLATIDLFLEENFWVFAPTGGWCWKILRFLEGGRLGQKGWIRVEWYHHHANNASQDLDNVVHFNSNFTRNTLTFPHFPVFGKFFQCCRKVDGGLLLTAVYLHETINAIFFLTTPASFFAMHVY